MSVTWLAWAASACRLGRCRRRRRRRGAARPRRAERVAVVGRTVRVEVVARPSGCSPPAREDVPVVRDFEAPRRAGEVGGAVPDAVDLDVVGVAVAAVPVVQDDDVGVLLAEDRGQPLGRLVDVGLPERRRVVVLLPARSCRSRGSRASATRATPSSSAEPSVSPAAPVDERLTVGEVVGGLAVSPSVHTTSTTR